MRKNSFYVLGLCFCLSQMGVASPEDDANLKRIETQIKTNRALTDKAARLFAKEPGADLNRVPPGFLALNKEINASVADTAKAIQDGRKSRDGLFRALILKDVQRNFGDLEGMYKRRDALRNELELHDRAIYASWEETKKMKAASPQRAELIQANWDKGQKERDAARAAIVSGLKLVQGEIKKRVKELNAVSLDEKIDKIESQLQVLEEQFGAPEDSIHAYRRKLESLFFDRDENGVLRTH